MARRNRNCFAAATATVLLPQLQLFLTRGAASGN
jgi:hypothetical protein